MPFHMLASNRQSVPTETLNSGNAPLSDTYYTRSMQYVDNRKFARYEAFLSYHLLSNCEEHANQEFHIYHMDMALLLSAANRPIQSGQDNDPVLQSHLDLEA